MVRVLKKPFERRSQRDLDKIAPLLKNITFFKENKVKEKDLTDIAKRLRHQVHPLGHEVIKHGDFGELFYLVLSGKVSVNVPIVGQQRQPNQQLISEISLKANRDSADEPQIEKAQFEVKVQQSHLSKTPGHRRQIGKMTIKQKASFMSGQSPSKDAQKPSTIAMIAGSSESVESKEGTTPIMRINQSRYESQRTSQGVAQVNSSHDEQYSTFEGTADQSPQMREVAILGPGKSFGELALVRKKPRAATVTCVEETHFATLDKHDFEICLAKIERKRLNQMLKFMQQIPCFSCWTHTSILKFSYYLKKEKFNRNQIIYKHGDPAVKIYIIKKGEFQLVRRLRRQMSTNRQKLQSKVFGPKEFNPLEFQKCGGSRNESMQLNLTGSLERDDKKAIENMPMMKNFLIFSSGSLMGEEDCISQDRTYTSTALCTSLTGSAYSILVQDFLTLKSSDASWRNIISKSLWKEHTKISTPALTRLSEEQRARNDSLSKKPITYDISEAQFQGLHRAMEEMEGKKREYQYKDRYGCVRTDRSRYQGMAEQDIQGSTQQIKSIYSTQKDMNKMNTGRLSLPGNKYGSVNRYAMKGTLTTSGAMNLSRNNQGLIQYNTQLSKTDQTRYGIQPYKSCYGLTATSALTLKSSYQNNSALEQTKMSTDEKAIPICSSSISPERKFSLHGKDNKNTSEVVLSIPQQTQRRQRLLSIMHQASLFKDTSIQRQHLRRRPLNLSEQFQLHDSQESQESSWDKRQLQDQRGSKIRIIDLIKVQNPQYSQLQKQSFMRKTSNYSSATSRIRGAESLMRSSNGQLEPKMLRIGDVSMK
ncbi:hypothetical protein FGO68_gene11952 [Halteria grandinella]|uniref:Cyclic nucleotide-binding domain-containing protein n=1 Tax=Halteria grandinella TaxID=5974 RepID=A0A8J8P155_HALGN|nr:hypothetical protein FGO68_gene11952 [Halteria grandinella]